MSSPMSIGAIVQLSLRNLNRLSPARPSLLIGWAEPIPPWGLCQL